jgi:hypothetical protein
LAASVSSANGVFFFNLWRANRNPRTLSLEVGRGGDGTAEAAPKRPPTLEDFLRPLTAPAVPSADQPADAAHTRPPKLSGGAALTSRATSIEGGSLKSASGTAGCRRRSFSADA